MKASLLGCLSAALLAAACGPQQPGPGSAQLTSAPGPAIATSRASAVIPEGFEARPIARIDRIVDGDTVMLSGGERIRVLGIDTPELQGESETERRLARNAKAELKRLLAAGRVIPVGRPGHVDKYERTLAYLHAPGKDGALGEDLGARLLDTGYARIYPSTHPRLAPYLQLQDGARGRGRGIWTEEGVKALGLGFDVEIDAANAGAHVGAQARVVGEIVETHRSAGAVYLNFGPDWKRDFTAVIVKTQWELFPPTVERDWHGRRVAVSGTIEERKGRPEIRLMSPSQVELLSD